MNNEFPFRDKYGIYLFVDSAFQSTQGHKQYL